MFEHHMERTQGALIAAMVLAGFWALYATPPGTLVPLHFDLAGQPDGWGEPIVGLFALPAMAGLLLGLQRLLPKIEPQAANLRRSSRALATVFLAITASLALLQAVIVVSTLGLALPKASLMFLLTGSLFVVLGNVMGKLRPNYSVGIRTPWTLANERVWDKTHRFGGKCFVIGGVAVALLPFLPLDPVFLEALLIAAVLVIVGAPVLKSYLLWREMQGKSI